MNFAKACGNSQHTMNGFHQNKVHPTVVSVNQEASNIDITKALDVLIGQLLHTLTNGHTTDSASEDVSISDWAQIIERFRSGKT